MRYTYDQPEYLDVDGARHLVQELKVYIQEILNGNIDITQYATKEELSNAVSSIDLTDYAKTSDIPSLDGYAKSTDIPSLEGYATKSYVDENIANVATGGEVDLSNYVTKDTVYTKEDVYTKEETDAKITEIEPISEDDIRALFASEGLATEEYVDNAVSNIPTTDLTGYATEEYVSTAINSIPATDLSNYYTKDETYNKTEVDTLVANSGGSSSGGEEGGGETPTPTVTMAFTTTATTVRIGGNRTVKVGYTDSNGTDVTDNYDTVFTITDATFNTSLLTMTDNGNTVTLTFDDEDIIGETFTLNAVDSGGICTPISVSMELIDIM